MAWVRIHDGALSHPKIVGMVDPRRPFDLWVWGLSYAQLHLTDGLIPSDAVPRFAGKAAQELCRRGLWEARNEGFVVHDHLEWNDSRELVKARQEAKEEERQTTRERLKRWREEKKRKRNGQCNALHETLPKRIGNGDVTLLTKPNQTKPKEREREERAARAVSPSLDPFTDSEITQRAGRFVERYQQFYQLHRKGARYALRPQRDYAAAVTLCQTWTDDARLDKLASIFLTTDHKFADEGSRTIPQFLALASWADSRLAEWEQQHAGAV